MSGASPLQSAWLGRVDYLDAWRLQSAVATRVRNGDDERLLLLEHDPVYTIGRRGTTEHLLAEPDELRRAGELVRLLENRVPRLAVGLEIKPTEIVSASEEEIPAKGYFVEPANQFVIHNFILDPNDPTKASFPPPPGFDEVARNESWVVYRRC